LRSVEFSPWLGWLTSTAKATEGIATAPNANAAPAIKKRFIVQSPSVRKYHYHYHYARNSAAVRGRGRVVHTHEEHRAVARAAVAADQAVFPWSQE
jgi:hypothetical protein